MSDYEQAPPTSTHLEFERQVREVLNDTARMLTLKNKAYGNSALDPQRIFSQASPKEQVLVRIDDKLSRIKSGNQHLISEDTIADLIGYLVILTVISRGERGDD